VYTGDKRQTKLRARIYSKCPECNIRSANAKFFCGDCKVRSETFIADSDQHFQEIIEDRMNKDSDVKDGTPIWRV
jgi:hypothetical protein